MGIQAKRYSDSNLVGSPEIQQYASLRQQEDADAVIIVTCGRFSKQAKSVADDLNMKLVDGDDLYGVVSSQMEDSEVGQYLQLEDNSSDDSSSTATTGQSKRGVECPTCGIRISSSMRTYVCHWEDCTLPEERPSKISAEDWQVVKDVIKTGKTISHARRARNSGTNKSSGRTRGMSDRQDAGTQSGLVPTFVIRTSILFIAPITIFFLVL